MTKVFEKNYIGHNKTIYSTPECIDTKARKKSSRLNSIRTLQDGLWKIYQTN